jgi:hypothetical protein
MFAAMGPNTWVHVHVPFDALANTSGALDTTHFTDVVLRTYHGVGNQHFFVDDVTLVGAEIFGDGFEGAN